MKPVTKKTTPQVLTPVQEAEPTAEAASELGAEGTDHSLLELVGKRVRDARARRFMTRKTLAEESGISLAYLARVENGTGNISLGLLHRLALALNLPIAGFLSPEEPAGADFTMIVEFLKRQPSERLAHIRRLLFASNARRIALVGIRGVGKSTLGPLLAERLGYPFIELNREIEKEADLEIDKIHSLYGQRGYRLLERSCLERIVGEYPEVVLATGGGIVAESATYEVLLASFFTIWLTAKPQVMFERVLAQHDARIASEHMRSEAINNIARTLEARQRLYELAHASYDTTGKSIERTVPDLLTLLPETVRRSSDNGAASHANPSPDRTVWSQT
jgi:XRE family transcriptional regulator, aerobic/anaerobic benzoate catabolism transcriptional regulator